MVRLLELQQVVLQALERVQVAIVLNQHIVVRLLELLEAPKRVQVVILLNQQAALQALEHPQAVIVL